MIFFPQENSDCPICGHCQEAWPNAQSSCQNPGSLGQNNWKEARILKGQTRGNKTFQKVA